MSNRAKKVAKRNKRKLRAKKLKVLRSPNPRNCGSCMACCVVFPVHDLPGYDGVKEAGTPCHHLTTNEEARCGIHGDPSRPPVCGNYKCLWLYDSESPKRVFWAQDRPDLSGVIFDLADKSHPAVKSLKKPVVVARPADGATFETEAAQEAIERALARGFVVAKVLGKMNYEFVSPTPEDASKIAKLYDELPDFKLAPMG